VGKAGMIVPPADTAALTKAITQLLNNPDQRAKYAKSGLERVNSVFSWPKAAHEVVEVYREAINDNRRFS
jgi:glycosyltransferase involved in cell wall biosynthesis